tara:strand:+ start:208 stop:477 length:270 start_codon:yes stop_codon:yes gene_type:complete
MARRRRRTPQENYAIKRKIEQLELEGIETERAIAAAFRMFREGELDIEAAPKLDERQYKTRKALRATRGARQRNLGLLAAVASFYKLLK